MNRNFLQGVHGGGVHEKPASLLKPAFRSKHFFISLKIQNVFPQPKKKEENKACPLGHVAPNSLKVA